MSSHEVLVGGERMRFASRLASGLIALSAMLMATAGAWGQALPLSGSGGDFYVHLTIGGKPALALVDTGAQTSSIDAGFFESLGLNARWLKGRERQVGASGVSSAVVKTEPIEVRIGDALVESPRMAILQLGGFSRGKDGEPLDAVVGMDVMQDYVMTVDFDHDTVAFASPKDYAFPAGAPLKMSKTNSMLLTRAQLRGHDAKVLLDTGAGPALHVSPHLDRLVHLLKGLQVSDHAISGMDGLFKASLATLPDVTLAGQTFQNVPASIAAQDLGAMDSIIGLELLHRFNIVFDFQGQRVWLTLNSHKDEPFEKDLIGLSLYGRKWPREIILISTGSPAAAAGFKLHEMVQSIETSSGEETEGESSGLKPGDKVLVTMADGTKREFAAKTYY